MKWEDDEDAEWFASKSYIISALLWYLNSLVKFMGTKLVHPRDLFTALGKRQETLQISTLASAKSKRVWEASWMLLPPVWNT